MFADVVFPVPVDRAFVYRLPDELAAAAVPGVRVRAPLGRRPAVGILTALRDAPPVPGMEVKDIAEVLDGGPALPGPLLELTRRLAEASASSWGELADAALPPGTPRARRTAALTPAGAAALAAGDMAPRETDAAGLLRGGAHAPRWLERRLRGVDVAALLERMARKGWVDLREGSPEPARRRRAPEAPSRPVQLDFGFDGSAAPAAVRQAEASLAAGRFGRVLLMGGREARYRVLARLLRQALAGGGRGLVLVAETGPAERLAERLAADLRREVALIHGDLAPARRAEAWARVRSGRAPVAVGTRSALFLPVERLRVAAVEDEHEEAHLQRERPAFDAREGARLRAEAEGAVWAAASATPTVSAYERARSGGYLAEMEPDPRPARVRTAPEPRGREILGPEMREALAARIAAGDGALLVLNRVGTAPYVVCAACGRIPRCSRCGLALAWHGRERALVCRACGERRSAADACGDCGGRLRLPRARGVEALEEEVHRLHPGTAVAAFDRETVPNRREEDKRLRDFRAGRVRVLVGTRLLARRPETGGAAFVGVVGPEDALGLPDYRAAERTYASLVSLVGLAAPDGEVLVQTGSPDHPAIAAAVSGDPAAFYGPEREFRRLLRYPPFASLAEIFLRGPDARALARRGREAAARIRAAAPAVEVLGPALATSGLGRSGAGLRIVLRAASKAELLTALKGPAAAIRGTMSVTIAE